VGVPSSWLATISPFLPIEDVESQSGGGRVLAAQQVEPAVRSDRHRDVDERVLHAPLFAGDEPGIALDRNQAARAAPDRRTGGVEAQDLVADEGRQIDDTIGDRCGPAFDQLGEVV